MNTEMKNWLVRTGIVIFLTVVVALIQKYIGIKVEVPPLPPMQIVVRPGPDQNDPFTGAKAWAVPVQIDK